MCSGELKLQVKETVRSMNQFTYNSFKPEFVTLTSSDRARKETRSRGNYIESKWPTWLASPMPLSPPTQSDPFQSRAVFKYACVRDSMPPARPP